MSRLDKILSPKIRNRSRSEVVSNVPEGLWHKHPACSATIHSIELQQNHRVCPKCSYHNPLPAHERLNLLLDKGSDEEIGADIKPTDPLKFKDDKKYPDRLTTAHGAAGEDDALVVVKGVMNGLPVVVAASEFRLIGGLMGSVAGKRLVQGVHRAVVGSCPFICVTASDGTWIQEGVNSLIQMTKTDTTSHLLTEKGLLFISILTDPTTGGISASFVFLGNMVLAEPNALIGFAGPRVIEQTMHEALSEDFQRAKSLLEKDAIDQTVDHRSIKRHIHDLIMLPCRKGKVGTVQVE